MNEDYLWDRTGKADPEIQELEQLLGVMRYEPRPFEIPAQPVRVTAWRSYAVLAVAASVALLVLVPGVLFFVLGGQREVANIPAVPVESMVAKAPEGQRSPVPVATPLPNPSPQQAKDVGHPRPVPHGRTGGMVPGGTLANSAPKRPSEIKNEPSQDVAQNKDAKDKLMLALRIASARLSLAQRKVQGIPTGNGFIDPRSPR
jgi:hypothetical protein